MQIHSAMYVIYVRTLYLCFLVYLLGYGMCAKKCRRNLYWQIPLGFLEDRQHLDLGGGLEAVP